MQSTHTISIIGCGWLGTPLAQALIQHGFVVRGSTTRVEKKEELQSLGVDVSVGTLSPHWQGEDRKLWDSDLFVMMVPPRVSKNGVSFPLSQLKEVLSKIKSRRFIYVSSTSVLGEDCGAVDEHSACHPESDSGKALYEVEKSLRKKNFKDSMVVRLGGLFGGDRQPAKSLSGKKNVPRPFASVNLIDRDQAVALLVHLCRFPLWGETFHGVLPLNVSRKYYYEKVCLKNNWDPPEFDLLDHRIGKTVSSEWTQSVLGFKFQKEQGD